MHFHYLLKEVSLKGKVDKYKSCFVVKRYSQVEGIDFGEIFSLVAKLNSIIFLLSVVATFDLEVEHMDVKTTFLNVDVEEEIYIKNHNLLW